METFVNKHCKNNPEENRAQFKENLKQAVQDKKNGVTCDNCGERIWAIGSTVSHYACFSCLTGEADSSGDYEIDEVCLL
ncbi:hypothetical protein [Sporosarcina aquimarina]|nr:hypothetical protein [Sporosarcina aquimarina]